ncbi:hypothetical protein D6829_00405 [Candidatus Pacearchaeota archaeon]|nr:MAG: hypothetical protein D6829_00405 [Candidatus Pacearchaeota archaeon]
MVRAQMKIQQMSFMIVALFIFFVLVGIFFIKLNFSGIEDRAFELKRAEAIYSIKTIAQMPELSCTKKRNFCIDILKAATLSGMGDNYSDFWPVESIEIYRIFPKPGMGDFPKPNWRRMVVFDSGKKSLIKYSGFVSLCKIDYENNFFYDRCEIGKLVLGVKK